MGRTSVRVQELGGGPTSLRKRCRDPGSLANSAESTFSATTRSVEVSRARHYLCHAVTGQQLHQER